MATPIYSEQVHEVFRSPKFPAVEYKIVCPPPIYSAETRARMMGELREYVEDHIESLYKELGGRFWFNANPPEGKTPFASYEDADSPVAFGPR